MSAVSGVKEVIVVLLAGSVKVRYMALSGLSRRQSQVVLSVVPRDIFVVAVDGLFVAVKTEFEARPKGEGGQGRAKPPYG